MDTKILQIIPAPNWLAVCYTDKKAKPDDPDRKFYERVACLALIEDDDGQRIVAVVADDCGPGFDGNFCVLSAPNQELSLTVVERLESKHP